MVVGVQRSFSSLTDVFWRHCLDVGGYILVELTSQSKSVVASVSFILVSPVVIIWLDAFLKEDDWSEKYISFIWKKKVVDIIIEFIM